MKTAKDVDIFINRAKVLKYHYKLYALLKSICVIFYTFLTPAIYSFVKIYIDTIEYKPFSTNGFKYIIYFLDRYFNYQWIFFARMKEIIFEKFVEVVIYLENQVNWTVQVIYLDNGTKFYPTKL